MSDKPVVYDDFADFPEWAEMLAEVAEEYALKLLYAAHTNAHATPKPPSSPHLIGVERVGNEHMPEFADEPLVVPNVVRPPIKRVPELPHDSTDPIYRPEGGEVMTGVACWHKDGVYVSKAHPYRAAKACLSGWACYEKTGPLPDDPGLHRGVTDEAGVLQWLNGEAPRQLLRVEGVAVPAAPPPRSSPSGPEVR